MLRFCQREGLDELILIQNSVGFPRPPAGGYVFDSGTYKSDRTARPDFLVWLRPLAFGLLGAESPKPAEKTDPWKPLHALIGKWEGDVNGEPGAGRAEREYVFVMNNRFIHVRNKSIYPPQEKNPKGETHEDAGFFSYDKALKKLMLRQFHIEGFVNQFALDSVSDDVVVFIAAHVIATTNSEIVKIGHQKATFGNVKSSPGVMPANSRKS